MSDLIITNGDTAVDLLVAAGLPGRMLPWRDVLHEGPLILATGIEALSDVRASYLSQRFGLPYAEVRADFIARDAILRAHTLFERVTIWLEHDLYDQLQLLQAIHFLHRESRSEGLVLVQADDFIGAQRPETVLRFADKAAPLTPQMLGVGAALWDALAQSTPEGLLRQLRATTGGFPYLRRALGRFLEELPAPRGGLSRSERVMLSAITQGHATPQAAFARLLATEEAAFMGDWSAFRLLDDLAFAPEPLVSGLDAPYPCRGSENERELYLGSPIELTRFGRAVIAGDADVIAVNGIDRWWAGTHLTGHDCWRWDTPGRRLVAPGGEPVQEASEAR